MPTAFIESNHTYARFGTQAGQTAGYRFIVFSYTTCIEHRFRLESQSHVLVAITALGTAGHHQFDGLVIVSQNLIPSFFLTGTGHFQVAVSGILDDLCYQRDTTETTGHGVEDRGTHVISFAQIVIVGNLGVRALVFRQVLNQVVGIAQQFKSFTPVSIVFTGKRTANTIAVHCFAGTIDTDSIQPSVKIQTPLRQIFEIFPRHIAI